MTRKTLVLSVVGLALAVFAAAAWYVTQPEPQAMSSSDSADRTANSPQAAATSTTGPRAASQQVAAPVAKTASSAKSTEPVLQRFYSPVLGPAEAPVTIVEFFDPACEACRAFYPIVKDIMAKHGDSVRLVLRYTPFHGDASEQAIRVLEAARMQGVYEPVLEAVLREQPRWASHEASNAGLILEIATAAGLDPDAAQRQMNLPRVNTVFDQDRMDVQNLGVRQTPTFFVNGQPLNPFGVEELRALVAANVAASEQWSKRTDGQEVK